MTTTSGILGTLALIIFTIIVFQWGAEKEYKPGLDEPTSHVIYCHPDGR